MVIKQIFLVNERYCPYCKRDVKDYLNDKEIEEEVITGCPNPSCKRSYVD